MALWLLLLFPLQSLAAVEPNTDGFYLSDFFTKMGSLSPSFLTDSTFCSWPGVSCDIQLLNVVSLSASGLGLSGPIPDNTIGKLAKLASLDLSNNSITALSGDIWGLGSSLHTLNLSSNHLTGTLSNNIGNFGHIQSLDLSANNLSGELPVALGSLPAIHSLDLSNNMFSGSLPSSILRCESLLSINLAHNLLTGTVPVGFGTIFKNLTSLNLAGNMIQGRIPDLSELNSLIYLNLSSNHFRGSVLSVLREPFQVVDLSNNQFEGHFLQVLLNPSFSWPSLVYLDVSGNRLSGELSGDWGVAPEIKHLNLAFNRFSRQQFPHITNLSALEYLNLSHTEITGRIPAEFSQLLSLHTLDLSYNNLVGEIPDLTTENLRVLDLSMNNLTGEIPQQLQATLSTMLHFNFSYNNLTLCAANIPPRLFAMAFIGSQNSCPIAADPDIVGTGMRNKGLRMILAIVLSSFFVLTGLIILAFGWRKRSRSWAVKQMSYKEEQHISGPFSFKTDSTTWVADVKLATSVPVVIFEKPLLNFTFADLLSATSHFDRGTLLAEGKCGPVYRGFLAGGIHVAVKVLVNGSTLTDQEAAKELERLGRIKHPNLVPLTGYCLAGEQRIAIYDYMENGNLQNLLHDLPLGLQATEDWSNDMWEEDNDGVQSITSEGMTTWRFRHRIALGTARALAFLHHGCFPQIVHRDVKASSIYLDSEFEPRLSDFGLAKIMGGSLEDEMSWVSPGYTPPEFSESENAAATTKSDVYGYGVVLFELITGKKPLGDSYPEEKETSLVGWARALVKKNRASRAVDPKIRGTGSEKQMEEALRIAYLCTADLPSKRPSMQQIVGLLKDIEPVADQ